MNFPTSFKHIAFGLCLIYSNQNATTIAQIDHNSGKSIRIIQISDTQIGFTKARVLESSANKDPIIPFSFDIDSAYFELAVLAINHLDPQPDVVVNTGDLVNDPENQEHWNTYKHVSAKIKAPLYELMGNHDGWSSSGVNEFRNRFGHADYYSFKVKDCLVVVLNSWYLKDTVSNPAQSLNQKLFLKELFKTDRSSFRIILLHHPLYLKNPNEADAYFNLPLSQRLWLINIASENNVKLILSGHSHNNNITYYKDKVTLITSGPVSGPLGNNSDGTESQRGFGLIDINLQTGKFTHTFVPLQNIDP